MPSKFFLYKYEVGDVIESRKKHPCGGNKWELTRVGVDCKLTCLTCGRKMETDRPTLEKMTANVIRKEKPSEEN